MKFSTFSVGFACVLFLCLFLEMNYRTEQRVTLKFLAKSGKSPIQCWHAMEAVYGQETMSKTQVCVWWKRFKGGDGSVKNKPKSGQPRSARTAANIQKIQDLVRDDGRRSVRSLSCETGLCRQTVWQILKKDLKLRRLCAKFVPRLLTDEQKRSRVAMASANLEEMRRDPEDFLARIVTGDETWISTFDPETKRQSIQWVEPGAPRTIKPLRARSVRKSMMTVFFDFQGIVMVEFIEPGEKIKAETYCDTLANLKENIRRKRPHLWERDPDTGNRRFLLHHDNASPHTATYTLGKIGEWGIEMIAHPPYSPDLAPCDFSLFPYVKDQIRGIKFESLEYLQDITKQVLHEIPAEFFEKTITDWVTH